MKIIFLIHIYSQNLTHPRINDSILNHGNLEVYFFALIINVQDLPTFSAFLPQDHLDDRYDGRRDEH